MSELLQLQDVPFGGLYVFDIPERTPFQSSITCADAILDQSQIEGRSGYRDVTGAILTGTVGTPQLLDRFRVSGSSARTVGVTGGAVKLITDPTTLTASDGVSSALATPFGGSAKISGAQLNDNYYLGTNESGVAMRRIKSDYTIESLLAIPQGAKPTATQTGALTWTTFSGLTQAQSGCTSQTNAKTGWSGMDAAWRGFSLTDNGNNDPLTGAYTQYKLAADFDARGYNWVSVAVSPHDSGGIGTQYTLGIYIAVDNAGSPGTYQQIGQIYDVNPVPDSPNLIHCYLSGLPTALLQAIRWIKIQCDGSSGGRFMTYGYMFLPAPPVSRTQTYYVDFLDTTTLQSSPLTEGLVVTSTDAVLAVYPDSRIGNSTAHSSGGTDDPLSPGNLRVWNVQAGKPTPALQDIGALITISGTTSAFGGTSLVVRLWKQTANGIQLVTPVPDSTGTYPVGSTYAQSSAYALIDPGGLAVLSNLIYKAGGVPPRCEALASFAGRLIAGYQNTIYVSNFTPTSNTSNPFPQFPDVPIETADGWSFQFASKAEQIQSIMAGDVVYILTNYGLRVLTDVDAPLFGAPSLFKVGEYGAVSRTGAIFAEDGRLFWCSYKGIYVGKGRTEPVEMSKNIRQYFTDTFQPDSTVTMAYQDRCLYVFKGTLGLRYNFLTGDWSSLTLSHSATRVTSWAENIVAGVYGENAWILTSGNRLARLQDTLNRDLQSGTDTTTGTKIPDWSFSTGFMMMGQPSKVLRFSSDVVGEEVKVYVARDMSGLGEREVLLQPGESVKEFPPDIYNYKLRIRVTGPNDCKVRRLFWGLEPVDVVSP